MPLFLGQFCLSNITNFAFRICTFSSVNLAHFEVVNSMEWKIIGFALPVKMCIDSNAFTLNFVVTYIPYSQLHITLRMLTNNNDCIRISELSNKIKCPSTMVLFCTYIKEHTKHESSGKRRVRKRATKKFFEQNQATTATTTPCATLRMWARIGFVNRRHSKDEDNVKTIMSNVLRHYVYFTGSAQGFCQSNKMVVCVNMNTHGAFRNEKEQPPIWYRYTSPIRLTFCEYLFQYTMSLFCLFNVDEVKAMPSQARASAWNNRFRYEHTHQRNVSNLRHSYCKRLPKPTNEWTALSLKQDKRHTMKHKIIKLYPNPILDEFQPPYTAHRSLYTTQFTIPTTNVYKIIEKYTTTTTRKMQIFFDRYPILAP